MSSNPPDLADPNDPNRRGQYPPPSQWNIGQEGQPSPSPYPPASHYPYPPTSYPPASYPQASYPPSSYPPASYSPASYPPPAEHQYPPPPHSQYPPPPAMHHPSAQGPYHLPPPPGAYRPPDVYAHPPPAPAPVAYPPAAPRQRTAIACSYCRRRKIRCSGFENSTDGRCSNCIRFNQECLFTPVSSQAQAFVPAHAAYPHLRNPQNRAHPDVMLYGAQGQPLPRQQQHPPETTLPPPQGMYPPTYGRPPHMNGATPPLAPIHDPRVNGRRGSSSGFEYPDPTNLAPVTPATSAPGYQAHGLPGPYYPPPPQHDRRSSPQTAYPYDGRHSSSPHNSPYPPMYSAQGAMTPPSSSAPNSAGANSANSSRGGLNVRDMLNPGEDGRDPSQSRTSTDSDMLNALNRRGLNK